MRTDFHGFGQEMDECGFELEGGGDGAGLRPLPNRKNSVCSSGGPFISNTDCLFHIRTIPVSRGEFAADDNVLVAFGSSALHASLVFFETQRSQRTSQRRKASTFLTWCYRLRGCPTPWQRPRFRDQSSGEKNRSSTPIRSEDRVYDSQRSSTFA